MENNNHISQDEFEKFERYILGQMEAKERTAFDKTITVDKILTQKLEEMKVILEGVEEAAFRNNLEEIHQGLKEKPVIKKQQLYLFAWKTLGIAASIFLIVGFFTWLFLLRPDENERLFRAYYITDPGLVTAMSSDANYEFDRGMVDYKIGNYKDAITRWESLLVEKPNNDSLNYFLGSAFLAIGDPVIAISYFEKPSVVESVVFAKDAIWYLALSYLSDGENELAKMSLEKADRPEKDSLLEALKEK